MGSYQSESRYYLHVQLVGIEPPIWRKVVVPGAISLHTLHKMLQVVMGWENAHLYLFRLTINEKTIVYGLLDPDWEDVGMRIRDSRRTTLDATVWAEWLTLTYEYDLGDSWMHQVTIEKIEHLADENLGEDSLWIIPRCLAGERACPPEDAGGIGGYTSLLELLQNPKHPEHERLRQWVDASYDPELFSVQQANSALAILE
ncbi:plasmid pRiA4b ORF-3 family protein [Ktedonobacter racemifer]|uniref:Plasmid pRiA4b ORF-3 family protein n=1 Tax=Ktedonobacter racemifer DSM 44963 TaxID=485913 RepID=D6TS64_KTERA|nr:plasmid pRiA4b ORF-3 family protein [Ktedonobacter racemifer]EFH86137.1 plasmid pRiA4b ORF-3 family protein [Ktedonobacter racemifer DSM 44963]